MNYAVIDIETTGLNPHQHEIIEIAILTKEETYYAKVIPINIEYANPIALKINGYNEKDWYDAVPARDVAIRSAKMLDGKIIIGHNPSFDMSFLCELWELYECKPYVDRRYIDTIVLAREHLPKCRSYSLDNIRKYLGWSLDGNHTAIIDAQDTERLFLLLWKCNVFKRWYFVIRAWFAAWIGKRLQM